jgi:hypothetical protein
MVIDSNGNEEARGFIHIRDGRERTLLLAVPDGANATCADSDGDGVAGVTRIEATFRDVESGRRLLTVLTPRDGEADERGRHAAIMRIGDRSVPAVLHLVQFHSVPRGVRGP